MSGAPVATQNAGGTAVAGFLLSGFLLALLGAILPAWGYHRDPEDFIAVGNFFLSLAVGLTGASLFAPRLMRRKGLSFLLVFASALSCFALLYLAFVSPPAASWWRAGGLLVLGMGAGLLNTGLFQALSAAYSRDPAGTVYRSGIWYGLGCLAATMLVGGTFYAYSVSAILVFMAAVPLVFAVVYWRCACPAMPVGEQPPLRDALKDFRSPGAILFALLLFFQFGNEWSLAGWLPILLIRRIGLSPKEAIFILGLYWLFLLGGRLLIVAVLARVRHGHLLLGSAISAVFGCLILYATNNAFGAGSGVFFLGAGFASIYPLVVEAIRHRFPYYHPGFFHGIFSLALLGGLLAPATLGYAAAGLGVGVVMGIPLLGTIMVAALLSLIWLESRVTGR